MWGHMISPFFNRLPFVSSLQGIGSPKTRFDGHAAKFCRHLVFEFCNTIGHKETLSMSPNRSEETCSRLGARFVNV
jgi:hypothetical protein